MAIAMLGVALVTWLTGLVFATLPGDEIPLGAALANAAFMGLVGLMVGSIAFALAQFVGRGGAAGIAAVVLFASWLVQGYRDAVAVFDWLAPLSFFAWTAGPRPRGGGGEGV
jgi:hypothetical protein